MSSYAESEASTISEIDFESTIIDEIDFSWIPENPIDFNKSWNEYEIIEYTSDDVRTLPQIIVTFLSGKQLIIVNFQNKKLIKIKQFLLEWIIYYNNNEYAYDLNFIINSEYIYNTIRFSLDNINQLDCIIKKRPKHIMIPAICTSFEHIHNPIRSRNIKCMGEVCKCGANGLLVPINDSKIRQLYEIIKNKDEIPDEIYDIPVECRDYYNDGDWMEFIDRTKSHLLAHFQLLEHFQREIDRKYYESMYNMCDDDYFEYEQYNSYLDHGLDEQHQNIENYSLHDHLRLDEEQQNIEYYSLYDFSRYEMRR